MDATEYDKLLRLDRENLKLKTALIRIAKWDELPWEYGFNYGSNGERDYYRTIATAALDVKKR